MDFATIITDAMLVLSAAEKILQVGGEAAPRIEAAIEILKGEKTLTDAERAQLLVDQQSREDRIDAAVAADDAAAASGTI